MSSNPHRAARSEAGMSGTDSVAKPDARAFRNLFGNFATGVTVVTTNVDGLLHGMTANAVCSLSLEPMLVLLCVDHRAACHGQVLAAGRFGLSILAADQRDLSERFARAGEPEREALRGAPFRLVAEDVPVLVDVLGWIACRLVERHAGGDHDIFVGEVLAGEIGRTAEPLVFFRGAYRSLTAP
jgi:flavin reductase (DIM6/NTAB) family NADH-FMN oxidoreductase RutF